MKRALQNPKPETRNPKQIRNPKSEGWCVQRPNSDFGARVSFGLRISVFGFLALLSTLNPPLSTFAQGTAFTYQGRLDDGANPASGIYDLRFTIYDALSGGNVAAGPLTNSAAAVSSGLFTVSLDFGQGVFAGADRWLEIAVRTNGAGAFTTLAPRQLITPTPYAMSAAVAVKLVDGLMVQPNTNGAPNVVGGASVNSISPNVIGATIAGGGAVDYGGDPVTNSVTGDFGTVGGGFLNTASASATVAGGSFNTASAYAASVGGGYANSVTNQDATVSGGQYNLAGGTSATVGGGSGNAAIGNSSTVSGGAGNVASGYSATVSGGLSNGATNWYASVVGGNGNIASGYYSTVAGGLDNSASGTTAMAAGGFENLAAGDWSFAAGHRAKANHSGSFVWADSQIPDFTSSTYDEFSVRAQGGARFFTGGAGLKLGATAQYYATGGSESLRIIRGVVDSAGNLIHGSDFSVVRTGTGAYTITFTSQFASFPAVTVSAQSGVARMATTTNVGVTGAQIRTFDATGAAVDAQFAFIAVGLQ